MNVTAHPRIARGAFAMLRVRFVLHLGNRLGVTALGNATLSVVILGLCRESMSTYACLPIDHRDKAGDDTRVRGWAGTQME